MLWVPTIPGRMSSIRRCLQPSSNSARLPGDDPEAEVSPSSRPDDPERRALPGPGVVSVDGVRLTSRQLQVILLACEGLKHAEMGECLGIGTPMVRRHLHEAERRMVTRGGITVRGLHTQIIDQATFERVQTVLASQRASGSRGRKHKHYLSGQLTCQRCDKHFGYGRHRGKCGTHYEYYSCLSRVTPTGPCGIRYVRLSEIEDRLERRRSCCSSSTATAFPSS